MREAVSRKILKKDPILGQRVKIAHILRLTISLMASGFFLAAIANSSGTVDPLALENSVEGVVGAGSFMVLYWSFCCGW